MGVLRRLLAINLCMFNAGAFAAPAENLCEKEMTAAAVKYRIPLGILFAVALTETGINGTLHAYALNLEGNTVYSPGKHEAIQRFNMARASGMKLIDVGCMQLNWYYHGENFASVAEMLDPHKNVDYGARFLAALKQQEGSWTMAVARYNAGKDNGPAQKRYVCQVLARLAQSGFGAWTPKSSAFCESELQKAAPQAPKAGRGANSLAQVP